PRHEHLEDDMADLEQPGIGVLGRRRQEIGRAVLVDEVGLGALEILQHRVDVIDLDRAHLNHSRASSLCRPAHAGSLGVHYTARRVATTACRPIRAISQARLTWPAGEGYQSPCLREEPAWH